MASTLIIMTVVGLTAAAVALWQRRLHRPAPTTTYGEPPSRLDRSEFRAPETPWLIVVFTAATCSSCRAVWSELAAHESATLAAQNVDSIEDAELHDRYGIDSVPTSVLVDRGGEVKLAVVGPLAPSDRDELRAILDNND